MEAFLTKLIGETLIQFLVAPIAPYKARLDGKVCRCTLVYIALYYAQIIYVHSTSPKMSRACIHLHAREHLVSNNTYHESLDMAYQCVAIRL